jgi:BolA protein
MTSTRVQKLREALEHALTPERVEIEDQSSCHAGHAGAADGRGHFAIEVVSSRFRGLPTTARHRLVYEAVGDLMRTDIHALSIRARTPDEAATSST